MFRHTEAMGEISGFGGGYEEVCQQMLENGVKWLEENKSPDLKASSLENVFGIMIPESEDAKKLEEAMMAGIDDATGAMHHAVLSRLFWIAKNGWKTYVDELTNNPQE